MRYFFRRFFSLIVFLCLALLPYSGHAAGLELQISYPYNLKGTQTVYTYRGSVNPLYISIFNYNNKEGLPVRLSVALPKGLSAEDDQNWQSGRITEGELLRREITVPPEFGQTFFLLYLRANDDLSSGEHRITVNLQTDTETLSKEVVFEQKAEEAVKATETVLSAQEAGAAGKFNWYIQALSFPVDNLGKSDEKVERSTLYIKDLVLEGFRSRMIGDGAVSWSALYNHPTAYLLLEMRNPLRDTRLLKFKAEIIDRNTGAVVPGLVRPGASDEESGQGWSGAEQADGGSTALLSLDGNPGQTFVLPLYLNPLEVLAGEYNLRVTVAGNDQEKVMETPLKIVKERDWSFLCLGFAGFSLVLLVLNFGQLKKTIRRIGAKGSITVALFAAVGFGGIELPSTLIGDFLHVLLGPFSGLLTGLLTGMLLYLLVMCIIVLYRQPGVLALMFFLKWLLGGMLFGRFTPIGLLALAVQIVVLEGILYFAGAYRQKELRPGFVIFLALLFGIGDAFITMINLEQMMFFYRLYYADWYIALYMLVNGFFYSTVGSLLGYRVGLKLRQVKGE